MSHLSIQTSSVIILSICNLLLLANSATNESVADFYTLKATTIDGEEISFERFRGKITLVVNIANACGYADSHYKSLGRILDILGPHRFGILAFPCNQFGQQEPGTSEDIKNHLIRNYGAEYMIFKKIDVIGGDAHPVFKNLAAQSNQAPEWNFWKYLVNENGRVMNAWGPKDRLEDIFLEVRAAVLRLDNIPAGTGHNTINVLEKQEL
ncbi:Glutathione peroxidase 7 [Chamberlinius hualienensis]